MEPPGPQPHMPGPPHCVPFLFARLFFCSTHSLTYYINRFVCLPTDRVCFWSDTYLVVSVAPSSQYFKNISKNTSLFPYCHSHGFHESIFVIQKPRTDSSFFSCILGSWPLSEPIKTETKGDDFSKHLRISSPTNTLACGLFSS